MVRVEDHKPPGFFRRNNLSADDVKKCFDFVQGHFPACDIELSRCQGECSFTIRVVTTDVPSDVSRAKTSCPSNRIRIVQFRLPRHAVATHIADAARLWFGSLAPTFRELSWIAVDRHTSLQVSLISNMAGTRFSDLQPRNGNLDDVCLSRYSCLLESLAEFYAVTWKRGVASRRNGQLRSCEGRVGSTMLQRLLKLERHLPNRALREKSRRVRLQLLDDELRCLPVVLTHGDLIPSNIMVDAHTWKMNGLVDWTESEYLPYGLSLYSLDRLLGYVTEDIPPRFIRYERVDRLRSAFWTSLRHRIPGLNDIRILQAVNLAREIGILLWHGIAFDDGRIDRVVEIGRDAVELAYLNAFLNSSDVQRSKF